MQGKLGMNLREWRGDTILDAGGNRSTRRKPARASMDRPFSYFIDQAGLGAFTAKSGRKRYNPPPLTVMWMNFDSPNFPSLYSLLAIISFQTCSNKCILYVLSFHKCIKIKYKTVNMYGVFLWLVQSSSRWNTIHSHRNYHVQLLSVLVGEFCHPARSQ